MLSKTTTNKIIDAICTIMKQKIRQEIGRQKFSVQMDSTQDTSVIDQESIIVRYVYKEEVKERLVGIKKVSDASGFGLCTMLTNCMESLSLKMEDIVGSSFDGALNMRGQNQGVKKYIKDLAPNAVYIWCYAHILN